MRITKYLVSIFVGLAAISALAGPVNVNTANARQIADELTGVGLAKAQAIVAFREANGPFDNIAQLAQVKGIGLKLLERNRDNIMLRDRR